MKLAIKKLLLIPAPGGNKGNPISQLENSIFFFFFFLRIAN